MELMQKHGSKVQSLTRQQCQKLIPALAEHEEFSGGIFSPSDCVVDPREYTLAMATACRATKKVNFEFETTVTGLQRDESGSLTGVITDAGVIPTEKCVIGEFGFVI